jgi:Leucine Rich repeats (2 copies)
MRAEFGRYLAKLVSGKMAFSGKLKRSVAAMSKEDVAEEVPDLLGDAGENDFDFVCRTSDGAKLEKGVAAIALLGTRGYETPVGQCEGLLLARSAGGKLVELIAVDVDGTLIPGSDKVVGRSFAELRLKALPPEEPEPKPARKPPAAAPKPKAEPAKPAASHPASELRSWWAELDRFGPGWRKELSRELDLKDGAVPTDRQLEQLFDKDEILIYVRGGTHDLTPLRRFRALSGLGLEGHDRLENMQILSELPGLRRLTLRDDKLTDISFLSRFTGLESLVLTRNPLASIAPLARLTKLEKLDLGFTGLADLGPLTGLTALRELVIWHNERIADLSPLRGLTRLTRLIVSDSAYSDLSPLAALTDLVTLDVSGPSGGGQVTSVAPLASLKKLELLEISDQPISDLSPLAGCTKLKTLKCRVSSPNASGFSALLGLKSLETIMTHPSIMPKQDRDAFKRSRPKVELRLT